MTPLRTKRTAQDVVNGYPKGRDQNRAQTVLELAHSEGQVIGAYEVRELLFAEGVTPQEIIRNITAWANATITITEARDDSP